jgi:hypothetical protein
MFSGLQLWKDLAVFVDIDLGDDGQGPTYRKRKTLLIQVKRRDRLHDEMRKLREQVKDMRNAAGENASAVLIVGADGIIAADAAGVVDDTTATALLDHEHTARDLFKALFCCQAGTEKWKSHQQAASDLNAMRATTVVAIEGRQYYRRRQRLVR